MSADRHIYKITSNNISDAGEVSNCFCHTVSTVVKEYNRHLTLFDVVKLLRDGSELSKDEFEEVLLREKIEEL